MQLKRLKVAISAAWLLGALVIALIVQPSGMGAILLGSLGLLPPLLMLLLWNDPAQTMSESIDEARR